MFVCPIGTVFFGRHKSVTMNGGYLMSSRPSGTLGKPNSRSQAQASSVHVPTAMTNSAPVVSRVAVSEPSPIKPEDVAKAAEASRRAEVNRKLNPSVRAIVERLRNKEALTSAGESGFIRNGKADVQVWLTEKSKANLAKLNELGFEVVLDVNGSRLIIGRLPVEKLEALAELTFVSYVSPQVSK